VVKASEDADEALDIFALGNIGANASLNYYLNNEKICAYKAQSDSLYLELVSGKDEISLADNTVTVGLSSFSQYQLGDMNVDGSVTINDVTTVQRWLVELETFSDEQIALADANGDGEINISDATYLQMVLAQ
ncbi:MAG: dockerin type I repeat-containing protein, partial [Ruminococcus sp.]|nr:dockerin type I repeat-containing protein [Ruminococcus sp.]